jgi:hypothetical protein
MDGKACVSWLSRPAPGNGSNLIAFYGVDTDPAVGVGTPNQIRDTFGFGRPAVGAIQRASDLVEHRRLHDRVV